MHSEDGEELLVELQFFFCFFFKIKCSFENKKTQNDKRLNIASDSETENANRIVNDKTSDCHMQTLKFHAFSKAIWFPTVPIKAAL